jgi:acetoacetyl-CoA reductase
MPHAAIVTGETRGLGRAIAMALKAQGHRVAATSYHGNDANALSFRAATGIPIYKWDVADFEACRVGTATVVRELGSVGVLVNNAGITADATLKNMSTEMSWRVINEPWFCLQHVPQRHREHAVQSLWPDHQHHLDQWTQRQFGQTNYCASKAGITGFTKALALEEAHNGITVNCVAFGYCATDMVSTVPETVLKKIVAEIPVQRLGQLADVARAVVFLAAQGAGFITGATLSVNGGQYMS